MIPSQIFLNTYKSLWDTKEEDTDEKISYRKLSVQILYQMDTMPPNVYDCNSLRAFVRKITYQVKRDLKTNSAESIDFLITTRIKNAFKKEQKLVNWNNLGISRRNAIIHNARQLGA